MGLLQQSCPADAWACYFQIPEKAQQAARTTAPAAGAIDDHARVAMLTATGFLYVQAGDRQHGDVSFRKAIQAYSRLLEDYDGWTGQQGPTVTPKGKSKTVGEEFYTYRNRMERLAMYCADDWGMRVVEGRATLQEALPACDHKLFRAFVRLRADRETNPIKIVHDERLRPLDYGTVADSLLSRLYAPQADWERTRGELVKRVGAQEVTALDAVVAARALVHQKKHDEAVAALAPLLGEEPALAETGITLRCEIANAYMKKHQHDQAKALVDEAAQRLLQGDEYLGPRVGCSQEPRPVLPGVVCAGNS